MMNSQFPSTLKKGRVMKTLILAASLAAVVISGCADLNGTYAGSSSSAGASASTQSDIDTPGNPKSPYPAATDAGIF
jgi:hypothetical protein